MVKLFAKKSKSKEKSITEEERQNRIAEAAYYLAEKRCFEPGHEAEDWLTAEGLVDASLSA